MSSGSTDKPKLVRVHWEDAFDSENGWVDLPSYHPKTARFETVGFLLPDLLDGYTSITSTFDPDEAPNFETVGMVTHILNKMVTSITFIEN